MAQKKTPSKPAKSAAKPSSKTPTFGKTGKLTSPLRERPLSPHLTIYKPQISSMLSIAHRGTGVALYIGAFVFAALLVTLTYGAGTFNNAAALIATPVGQVLVTGWSFCLFYHLCNGIRHLTWDAGYGFKVCTMNVTGIITVIVSLLLTVGAWVLTHPEFTSAGVMQ